jgi:MFS transporter, FHS family, glucose/mannose:H+ symporter
MSTEALTNSAGPAVRKNWLSTAAYCGMLIFGIVMALLGSILPLLSQRARFDMAEAGGLFLLMNFCMLVSMLGLGPLTDKFGKRLALVAGALLVAAALFLLSGADSYQQLLLCVLLLGAGGGALNGGTNVLIADLHAQPQQKAAALNLLGIFFGFGAMLLPFFVGTLVATLGLNKILYITLGIAIAPAILFLTLPFPRPKQQQGFRLSEAARVVSNPVVLLLGFVLFFQSGNEFIIGGYTSLFLTNEMKMPFSHASYLLAAYWAAIMVGRIVSSKLLARFSGYTLVLLSSLGSAAGVILLLVSPGMIAAVVAVVVIGLSFASIFPTTLGIAGSKCEDYSGTAFGILFAIALTGGMILPWAVGQVADAYGLRLALVIPAMNAAMIFLLQLLIWKKDRSAFS